MTTTPEEIVKRNRGAWNKMDGHWPRGQVYDQDRDHALVVDPNYCTGCAVANVYQAQTGERGMFARTLYERARARVGGPHTGAALEEVASEACSSLGGTYHLLLSLEQTAAWLDTVGPVAVGLDWTIGMQYPTGRGGFFQRHFGARWMDARGPAIAQHAVAILGGSHKQGGYFVIENSHGWGWGNKGLARLAWSDYSALVHASRARAMGFVWEGYLPETRRV